MPQATPRGRAWKHSPTLLAPCPPSYCMHTASQELCRSLPRNWGWQIPILYPSPQERTLLGQPCAFPPRCDPIQHRQ